MEYTKVAVDVNPLNEVANELLMAQMGDMGFDSFAETDKGFDAFIPSKDFDTVNLDDIYCPLDGIKLSFNTETIADQNWNKVWEENYFQPIVIGNECVVRSTFHQVDETYKYEIIINPQMAFGTGHHETTSLMMQFLMESDMQGADVLDMGCGTAILGMFCSMKGANSITGIDIDEWAYNNAIECLSLNNVSNMEILLGGAELLNQQLFDVVLANINRNILLNDMHAYANVLKQGGRIFFSGFYLQDLPLIDEEAKKYGLKRLSQKTENNWTAAAYSKTK